MDIFKRQKKYAKYLLIAGAVLFSLGAALLAYTLNVLYNSEPAKLTDIDSGAFVYADIVDLAGPYATNEDNGNKYFYAMDEDGYVFILETDKKTGDEYDRLFNPAEKWEDAAPLHIEGWICSSSKELRPLTLDIYEHLLPGRPLPSDNDPFVTKLVSTAAKSQHYLTLLYVSAVALFIGLLLLLAGCSTRKRVETIRQRIAAAYPGYDDFSFLEERKTFEIPDLRLFVKDQYLFTEKGGLNMVDLREVGWIYARLVKNRSTKMAYLRAHLNTGKKKSVILPLTANVKIAEQKIGLLRTFIEENYPSILIGETKENKALYKSRLESGR